MINTELKKAAAILQSGGIILYPTDTIWGIGCDACRPESVQNIYRIKQRDDRKSMLVLVDGIPMLEKYIDNIPVQALELLSAAVKPTTIIYPAARNLAENLIASDGSIGIRISSDPFCKQLIQISGKPIVSTSANISGDQAPAIFREIKAEIRDGVDYVVNWRREETTSASPSAILKLEADGTIITLRP